MGDLCNDKDYVALTDATRLRHVLAEYDQRMMYLESDFDHALDPKHWQVVEEMSSGERLWYVAGAAMAAAIEKAHGRSGLLKVTVQGPDAFFDAFEKARTRSD